MTRRGFFPGVRLTRITGEGAFLKTNSLLGSRYVGRAELYRYVQLHLQASRAGNANGRESRNMRGRPGATPVPTPRWAGSRSRRRYGIVALKGLEERARAGADAQLSQYGREMQTGRSQSQGGQAQRDARNRRTHARGSVVSLRVRTRGGWHTGQELLRSGKIDEHHKKALGEEELTQA